MRLCKAFYSARAFSLFFSFVRALLLARLFSVYHMKQQQQEKKKTEPVTKLSIHESNRNGLHLEFKPFRTHVSASKFMKIAYLLHMLYISH